VRDAVVVVREDIPGDTRLVAYVVAHAAQMAMTASLGSFLQKRLPVYMLPSAFVLLEALPLTASGKIDRRALPAPDSFNSQRELEESYVAPRTSVEEALVTIWAEILSVERVSVHDNFFHLGGHSLLATQLISRVRDSFQVELPLRTIFETATVSGMSVAILQRRAEEVGGDEMVQMLAEIEQLSEGDLQALLPTERQLLRGVILNE
jgi:acyl carrier protein